jgi:hypothetical protein
MISDEAQRWLDENGFRNYCFVSYPYTGARELEECAAKFKSRIESELEHEGIRNAVYLARDIPPGVQWPDDLTGC